MDRVKKLFLYLRKHLVGVGIAALVIAMALTVAKGVSGQSAYFDPKEVDTWSSLESSKLPGRMGYDLSGEGEDSEEVSQDTSEEKEEGEQPEEENPRAEENELFSEKQEEQIVLPDSVTEDIDASKTVDATTNQKESDNKSAGGEHKKEPTENKKPSEDTENQTSPGDTTGDTTVIPSPGDNKPSSGNDEKPGEGVTPPGGTTEKPEGDRPVNPPDGTTEVPGEDNKPPTGGDSEKPGTTPPTEEKPTPEPVPPEEEKPLPPLASDKFTVIVGGEKKEFDTEDDALAWIVDHEGKNKDGQYFEGFVKDEDGNCIPSYTDKENFDGSSNGEIVWDYLGDSNIFAVPEGTRVLELSMTSQNKNVEMIVIPKTVTSVILGEGNSFPALEKYIVSADNPSFISIDGVLYQKNNNGQTELCAVPAAKKVIASWSKELALIRGYAFYHSKIERLEIPETVTTIQSEAFMGAYLGTIVLPESVHSVGSFAFAYADPEKEEKAARHTIVVRATKPPLVTNTTFYWMDYNLEKKLGEPTTEIFIPVSQEDYVYEKYLMTWGMALVRRYGAEAALQILKTEDGAQDRFEYYEEDGRSGFRKIGEESSYWSDATGIYRKDEEGHTILVRCNSLSSVINLEDIGIVAIEEGAFDSCTGMVAIRLPETLETMPEHVFAQNRNLRVIISYTPELPAQELGVSNICSVFVRPEAWERYQNAWGNQVRKILGTSATYSVTSSGLVMDCNSARLLDVPVDLSSLSMPSYITSIYQEAFKGNTTLRSLSIPSRIKEVGEGAFRECSALTSITWGTAAAVPDTCFEGCKKLRTFAASGNGHSLKIIGARAFYNCESLETVLYYSYLGSNGGNYYYYYYLQSIGEEAFYGCTSMTYAYLHESVTEIGAYAFEGSGLTQLYWYTKASVPERCFANCASLKTIGWGAGLLTELAAQSFYGCSSLTEFLFPASIQFIGEQALEGRDGNSLTLTFEATTPIAFRWMDELDTLVIYVPDSKADGDAIYRAYLNAWEDWLGPHPENLLKTKDGAEKRVFPDGSVSGGNLKPEENLKENSALGSESRLPVKESVSGNKMGDSDDY